MIVVHHLDNSRSQRVLWLLEELGQPYELRLYKREASGLAPDSLRAVHPLGKSPVVTLDADGQALTLAESGAIVETLVERFGAGRLVPPPGTQDRLRWRYWLHYAEGSAMPPLLLELVFARVASAPMPFFVKPIARAIAGHARSSFIRPQIARHLDFIEAELARSGWFAGEAFSAADVQMSFPLEAADAAGLVGDGRPRVKDFLDRIHARPGYEQALARGGAYSLTF